MKNFLAFDLGASSGRAITAVLDNGVLSMQEIHRFKNGPMEIDGELYWDFHGLCAELTIGLEKALQSGIKLDGISIDTWGVDYVFFDKDSGKIRRMPYNYRDQRSVDAAQKVWAKIPREKLYRYTGIQCMTINTIYQLYAHYEKHPEDFENSFFLPMADAFAFYLGGDPAAEYTMCSTTNLLDPDTRQWHWQLIDELGLPRSVFPEIVPPASKAGYLKEELCRKFNCDPVPIYRCASHDTASAVAAVPANADETWAYLSAGTWALLGVESDHTVRCETGERESVTNEGGINNTIRLLTNIMGSWLFQELRRNWNEQGKNISFNDMENMAENSPPCKYFIDPNHPDFAVPDDLPKNIRRFLDRTGQASQVSDAEIVRCVYDSLALYFRTKLGIFEQILNTRCSCLNIVGGGTKDDLLMQLTADALDRRVIAGPVEATAAGNILVQALAAGELNHIDGIRDTVRKSFDLKYYDPDPVMADIYRSSFEKFYKTVAK